MLSETTNSQDFQDGYTTGEKACSEDLARGLIEGVDPEKHSPDWYAGFLAGYKACLEEAYERGV